MSLGALKRHFASVAPGVSQSSFWHHKLDDIILSRLKDLKRPCVTLSQLSRQYLDNANRVLHQSSLPYEPRPSISRRVHFSHSNNILLVAHAVANPTNGDHFLTVSSGFRLNVNLPGDDDGSTSQVVLTCAHTFEQISRSSILHQDGILSSTFILAPDHGTDPSSSLSVSQASGIPSSLPKSDLMLLKTTLPNSVCSWPVSPYPVGKHAKIRMHFLSHQPPTQEGWQSFLKSSVWSSWIPGHVVGYRDFAGRETQPGTYDELAHLLFDPIPSFGSSGGPIVDEESGAVVGVISGSRLENRVSGTRGWGIPSETIFEMFSLPGLEGKA